MKVTAKIKLDLQSQNYGSSVCAVQGDGGSRCVEAALLDGGKPWNVPAGVTAAVAYKKPDFTKGLYDKLADGTPAVTVRGSTVTVVLAKQMLTVPGSVQACIVFNNAALDQLTTFPFTVAVAANPVIGAEPSDDYIRLQWLEEKLDEYLEKFAGGVTDEAVVQRIVDEYLAANPPEVTETDPTIPAWAKQPTKPTYTAAEVGALPDTYTPPSQTAQQVGADPAGTAASAVSQHNTDATAHNDLRLALQGLSDRINAALDSDDTTLDQMSEVVAYIKSNKNLIDAITTSKVSVADIVNDLVTNVADKPLSAAQGVALKQLIDDLQAIIPGEGGSGIAVTGATVGQTIKIAAVDDDGVPTAWEPVDFPSGGGNTTQKEEITTVSVGSEAVVLDGTAPEQVVNLSWAVDGARTIPAFTNYYIANASYSYPRKFDTSGYTQFFSNAHHGNSDAFVAGHKYFQAMQYSMDDESTAKLMSFDQYITPTGSDIISGSGWVYGIKSPSSVGQIALCLGKTSTGTGTINYVYCIDVTALEEAGVIAEGIMLNELAELFGELPLIPGQDYEGGSVGDGTATLSINRNGETITVDNTSSTATVKGGDILSVEGGSVTFLLTVLKTVAADEASVWSGKKWVAFGDSLTDESINADKKYYRYIEEKTGITVTVMGKGGTGYYKTYDSGTAYGQRMAQVPADADIITIFGSVNDWHTKSANVEMGNASDTMEAGTLAGYINECIDVAIEKAPYAQIALVTPMDYHGLPDDTLEGIANIIKAVAAYRKIKCLDMYHESGFHVDNTVFAQQFTTDYSETAESYGHPNNLAHERLIAPEFMELLKRMILTA